MFGEYLVVELQARTYDLIYLNEVILNSFDILCFSESWLTEATKQLINFQGYQSFHSLRPINKRGGGISIFIKDSIRATHLNRHSLSEDHIETLFVEINTGDRTSYIGTIYKPPSADCNVFIDGIQNILSTINQSKIYDLMLCGDFNIDLLNKDCNNSTSFLNTMYSLSLLPIISKPTMITDNSATLIDNFFINEHVTLNRA